MFVSQLKDPEPEGSGNLGDWDSVGSGWIMRCHLLGCFSLVIDHLLIWVFGADCSAEPGSVQSTVLYAAHQ